MKKQLLIGSMLLASTLFAQEVHYVDNPAVAQKGMAQAKGLIGAIKPSLMSAMKEDHSGVLATTMCASSAKEMTQTYNKTLPEGSSVRRTALKYRNPENKPDATDRAVMEKFEESKAFKKPLVVDMGESYRVYKALPTHKPCLICHGDKTKMPPKMQAILKERYPADLATGFTLGSLRGVIVSTIEK